MKPRIRPFLLPLLILPMALSLNSCALMSALINTGIKVGLTKLILSCVPEGTHIDTPEGSIAIEDIEPGQLVIGYSGEAVRVLQVHSYAEDPTKARFHKLHFTDGAVVDVCDMHRIGGARAQNLPAGSTIGEHQVSSVEIYGDVHKSYDLLTEDDGYRISGVPVNSMIEELAAASRGSRAALVGP